ncbi:uncharacterized protein A1O9_08472, partial [Exophiala aquamarina CBS 119918]
MPFPPVAGGGLHQFQVSEGEGSMKSVHMDDAATATHIANIRSMVRAAGHSFSFEVVLAHDIGWSLENSDTILPGKF